MSVFFNFHSMVHDQISLLLKDISKLREELSGIKKDMKQEEKIENEEYLTLKKTLKDLRSDKKIVEDEHMEELHADDHYNKLRELKMQKEEEMAQFSEKLMKLLEKLPPKPFEMTMETDAGPVRVQVQPEMKMYLNGREYKK